MFNKFLVLFNSYFIEKPKKAPQQWSILTLTLKGKV